MQTLRASSFPTVHSSFKRHRLSIDHPRFPLNLTLSKTTPTPVWASLPTPPMSGSPPQEPPRDPPQLAGRRRKRSDTPPETTTAPVTSLPSLTEQSTYPYGETQLGQSLEGTNMEVATQPILYLPPLTYGAGPARPLTQYNPQDIPITQSPISPRSTRKTKAHVASACVNCKKKHLRCDNSRPCRRCVQAGKEDTCKDVEHKKRGRPPLKPEDPTSVGRVRGQGTTIGQFSDPTSAPFGGDSRGYGSSFYPPILPNAQGYMYGHHRTPSRTSAYSGLQSPYAQPSVAPSPLTATVTGFNYSRRPLSTSSGMSVQSQSPYSMQGSSQPQEQYSRPQLYTSGYNFPGYQPEIPSVTQGYYVQPLFPRELSQQQHQQQQQPPPPSQQPISQSMSQTSLYNPSNLQLPPIRPVSQIGTPNPAFSVQQPPMSQLQQSRPPVSERADDGRERDPKRPKMDIQGILGPKND